MKKFLIILRDAAITAVIITAAFYLNVLLFEKMSVRSIVPMIYVLGVFFVSVSTEGFVWGILASVASVLMIDYAFIPPYRDWALSYEVISSAIVILVVALTTGTFTTMLKKERRIKAAGAVEHMRANLMRSVSHDLRTPLTSIYASSSAILDNFETLTYQQHIELIREIREESEGLIRMVENMLLVTRISNDDVKVTKTPTVLEELIDSVVVRYNRYYPELPLELDIPDEFVSIPMDAVLIGQVLNNMLENAVIHARGMTRLILRVSLTENSAVFEVSDDGCGIPNDRLDKIFNGYFASVAENQHGSRRNMGIGLNVCAAIVNAHDGTISACNNSMGGASFLFTLERDTDNE